MAAFFFFCALLGVAAARLAFLVFGAPPLLRVTGLTIMLLLLLLPSSLAAVFISLLEKDCEIGFGDKISVILSLFIVVYLFFDYSEGIKRESNEEVSALETSSVLNDMNNERIIERKRRRLPPK